MEGVQDIASFLALSGITPCSADQSYSTRARMDFPRESELFWLVISLSFGLVDGDFNVCVEVRSRLKAI